MNLSATLNIFRLLGNPSLCLPHATLSTFDRLPISIATALTAANGGQRPDIRAVVLDKDNCFAKPKDNSIYGPYQVRPINFKSFLTPVSVVLVSDLYISLSQVRKSILKKAETFSISSQDIPRCSCIDSKQLGRYAK